MNVEVLDLGSLQIPLSPKLEVSLDVDADSGQPVSVTLVLEHSLASLQLFAEARNQRSWPQVRDAIVAELNSQYIDTQVVMGRFGTEVHCVMPTQDESGALLAQSVRFLGIDGDRWFLRVTIGGDAAVFDEARDQMDDLLEAISVVRGTHAAPPGERLPLLVPDVGSER